MPLVGIADVTASSRAETAARMLLELMRSYPNMTFRSCLAIGLYAKKLSTNTHFQLFLPYRIRLPSITANLLPLPHQPTSDTTTDDAPTTIPAPSQHKHHPTCPFQPPPPATLFLPSAHNHVTLTVRINTLHSSQYPINVFLRAPTLPNFSHS